MDLSLRSFVAYAAALAVLVVGFVVWAALSIGPRVSIRPREPQDPEGHFHWANAEMAEIAEAREPDARMAATLLRAEMEVEVGRIIAQLSDERRGGSRASVSEAFARGVGVVRAYRQMQWRMSQDEHKDPLEARLPSDGRFLQLRRAMETNEPRAASGQPRALIGSRS